MHTIKLNDGWYANHNGDFSGNVLLSKEGATTSYAVPFSVLKCVVATWVQQKRVEKIQSEEDANKILLSE